MVVARQVLLVKSRIIQPDNVTELLEIASVGQCFFLHNNEPFMKMLTIKEAQQAYEEGQIIRSATFGEIYQYLISN
jgi:hypothetical protein